MPSEKPSSVASVQSIVHTPGPWKWDGKDLWHVGNAYLGERSDDPHLFTGIEVNASLFDSPVVAANKRLIAAAPEMLEAIKDLVAWAKRSSGTSRAVVDKAKAAIEKATGQPWQKVV